MPINCPLYPWKCLNYLIFLFTIYRFMSQKGLSHHDIDEIKKDNDLHCSQNNCCIDVFAPLHWHASFQTETTFTIHIVIANINNLNQPLNPMAIKSLNRARKCWNYIAYKFLFNSVIVQIGPKLLWYVYRRWYKERLSFRLRPK